MNTTTDRTAQQAAHLLRLALAAGLTEAQHHHYSRERAGNGHRNPATEGAREVAKFLCYDLARFAGVLDSHDVMLLECTRLQLWLLDTTNADDLAAVTNQAGVLLDTLPAVVREQEKRNTPRPTLDEQAAVYIASLSDYNAGRLVGRWFELAAYTEASEFGRDITAYLLSLGRDEYGQLREEHAAHDYQGFPRQFYSEYTDFAEAIAYVQAQEELNEQEAEPFEFWLDDQYTAYKITASSVQDFRDAYAGHYERFHADEHAAVGEYLAEQAEENGELASLPESIRYHIDWAGVGRDACYNSAYWAKNGHVFHASA